MQIYSSLNYKLVTKDSQLLTAAGTVAKLAEANVSMLISEPFRLKSERGDIKYGRQI